MTTTVNKRRVDYDKVTITTRLPEAIARRLDQVSKITSKTKSTIFEESLILYFSTPPEGQKDL